MDYKTAVKMALDGKKEGLEFLYESTFRDKYYIALKYLGNEADAQDALQDSYEKAFHRLKDLREPERFPQWLGQIVANTAKNMLTRKKPLLFAESAEENGTLQAPDREDDSVEFRPEEAYTQKETQELVRELIGSLSDEQRMCILMFYLEEQSIHDIAESFRCSENTVKSRLYYGRQALKRKAEQLQKAGYKLYGAAPLPLLLYLLGREKGFAAIPGGTSFAAGKGATQTAAQGGAHAGKAAAGTFFHTVAGKVVAAVICVAVAGGVIGGVVAGRNAAAPETAPAMQAEESAAAQTEGSADAEASAPVQSQTPVQTQEKEEVPKNALSEEYKKVLQSVAAQEDGYDASEAFGEDAQALQFQYALQDLNQDGIPELLVSTTKENLSYCSVYFAVPTDAGYEVQRAEGGVYFGMDGSARLACSIPGDENGLYYGEMLTGNGEISLYRVTLEEGSLITADVPECQYILGEESPVETKEIAWHDFADEAPLASLAL